MMLASAALSPHWYRAIIALEMILFLLLMPVSSWFLGEILPLLHIMPFSGSTWSGCSCSSPRTSPSCFCPGECSFLPTKADEIVFFQMYRSVSLFFEAPCCHLTLGGIPERKWRRQVLLIKFECILNNSNSCIWDDKLIFYWQWEFHWLKHSLKRWWWWSWVGKRWFSINGAKRIFQVWWGVFCGFVFGFWAGFFGFF